MENYVNLEMPSHESLEKMILARRNYEKRLNEFNDAYESVTKNLKYYKWKIRHPLLSRIPFVKQHIRKKIGL